MPDETPEGQAPQAVDPEGAAAQPAGGWAGWSPDAPQPPERPRSPVARILEAVVWGVGIATVLFLGRVGWLFDPGSGLSGYEKGVIAGSIVGAVVVGLAFRWAWVKVRKRGRVISPWILLGATAALAINITRSGVVAPVASVPIETYAKIGAPYALTVPAEAVRAQFLDPINAKGARSSDVREVTQGSELLGYLVVADLGASSDAEFLRGAERGFEETPGNEAHQDTVAGRGVVVGTAADAAVVIWVESPYMLVMYALDIESAKLLAASVMAAYP